MMPTPSPVAAAAASASDVKRVDDDDDNRNGISISTATVTLAPASSQQRQHRTETNKTKVFLRNGNCRSEDASASAANGDCRPKKSPCPTRGSGESSSPSPARRSLTHSHPLSKSSSSPVSKVASLSSITTTTTTTSTSVVSSPKPINSKPPVASLSPGDTIVELPNPKKPVVNFCPIQFSSPDSSSVSLVEAQAANALSPSDCPTTPPYPPPPDAEFPPTASVVRVEALVHAEPQRAPQPAPTPDGDPTLFKSQSGCEPVNQDSGIGASSLGINAKDESLPSPSRTESVLASSSSIPDSPAVRPKHPLRLQPSSSPQSTRRRNPSSLSSSSSPPPHSQATLHLSSSSSLPPSAPISSSSPLPPFPQRLSPTPSVESTLALTSPKRRPLLNRPSTSLSAASATSGKDLFESFEGANYSFDSLPGIDDLNSYEMPHSKKLVNAKEAFKSNVDSSPTCEIPGWHTSLAQRSLKYLDAPLSSAYEEPPLTFVSASGRGLWGQSGDWDLRTGSGEPVKGPEARSVAAAMAAMLYEEGYSDILPPQVGLKNQLECIQPTDAPALVSPTSPSTSLHDDEDDGDVFRLRPSDDDRTDDVLHATIVYTGAVLPTLHPEMQENMPVLPSARDLYENDSSDEELGEEDDQFVRRRRRLPSTNFKIFSGPSTPDEPPPSNGFKE